MNDNYVIFGAGRWGSSALKKIGKEKVSYFIDNRLSGELVEGIPVVGLEYYKTDKKQLPILIATMQCNEIIRQLAENGISDWSIYTPEFESYYPKNVLVYNKYEKTNTYTTEKDYSQAIDKNIFTIIKSRVDELDKTLPLFKHVEIETYNRCNGVCDFCPVSVLWETRQERKMEMSLFYKIIDELSAINYDGRLALFSNNEPFLDERIMEMHKYTRQKLPKARMHLFTNGTLLTIDKFIEIIEYLDELVIDNYNQKLKLIPNAKKIKEYCEIHPELIEKVTISVRKPKEILSTRGGDAPNRKEQISYENTSCINPFEQMIIRPDGKVSLCCNDPLGKNTMGDVSINSLQEVWFGDKLTKARKAIKEGRQFWNHCKYCDVFNI